MSGTTGTSVPTAGSLAAALAAGPVVLDGGLSTLLESGGEDVSSSLWSARLLRDAAPAVVAAHAAFFAAGAQVATTASYQASVEGFARHGVGRAEAEALLRRSVELAREAQAGASGPTWVAASVGPYGAVLADGSEYTGAYADPHPAGRGARGLSVNELRAFHRPRLDVLASAGPDVLACETLPALSEVEALAEELAGLGVPAWISLTVVVDAEGTVRTRRGEAAAEAFAVAHDVDAVVAVGVNCLDPRDVLPAVREAARVSGGPVVAYPNSGERWDAAARAWSGRAALDVADVHEWVHAGARLVGGCCRVGPGELRGVADALAGQRAAPEDLERAAAVWPPA
jgi:homocysteine S-methyltransferase